MTTARLTHKSTDSLPEFAKQILVEGFRGKKNYRAISKELAAAGVKVNERTVARRGSEWRAEERRKQALEDLGRVGAAQTQWSFEELTGLLETLDLSAGFPLRGRRSVGKAVSEFLSKPNCERARAVETELLRFRLQIFISQKPQENNVP